jgi:PAS domain S-box-containing protein
MRIPLTSPPQEPDPDREEGDVSQTSAEAEEKLIEREEELQSLIACSTDGITIIDETGMIITWNRGMEMITGLPLHEVLGMPVWDLQTRIANERWAGPDSPTRFRKAWDQILQDDTDPHFDHLIDGQIRTPEGEVRCIQQRVFRIPRRTGFRIGCITRDMTGQKQAEESLRESEEKFRMLVQSTRDGVILNDDQGVILEWNPAMEQITGIRRSEAIGCTLPEVASRCAPADTRTDNTEQWLQYTIAKMNQSALSPENPFIETSLTHLDGSDRTIGAKNFQFSSKGRTFYGAIVRDITERKRIENAVHESEEKYRTVVEMSPDAIMIHQQGRVVYTNPAANHLYRATRPEALIGKEILDLIHPDCHARVQQNIQDDLSGKDTPPLEVKIICLDGTIALIEGKGKRILFKGNPAIQIILRDVTERKKVERQLKEHAESLRRSNEDLELFAYIAAHDLQEPIRGIVTFSQILLNQCKEDRYPLTEKYLRIIENAGLKMHRLIKDLRTYSGVQTHAKPFEPLSMEVVLSHVLDTLQLTILEVHASITSDPLPLVMADSTQISQVLQNLIDNAIKFRREGVSPHIHISVSPQNGMWKFAIRDNGIGIRPEYLERIFLLFERLHRRDSYPGTGLGLALCKRIVDRHGGRIWVESEVGTGSTFYFTLPGVITD